MDSKGDASGLDPAGALAARLRAEHRARITGELVVPSKAGRYASLPAGLDARLARALAGRGIERLYTHQAAAWDSVQAGRHSVIVTPTASGKTLCYNLPVLQAALSEQAKALYMFPTKALAQDQVAELTALNQAGNLGVRAFTFDGDTPGDARKAVRTRGDIVVTNPDMLHQGILPHHTKWAQFFESLRFVVIDEMHTYRGVFGSHVANVLRRLQRVCHFYGSDPLFILCSATIANPAELAAELISHEVNAITDSGAPQGAKHLLLWNPPVVNPDLGIRASARSQTTRIAKMAVKRDLKSIVFAQSRLMVEVLTKYMKDAFDKDPRHPARVAAYRGGYLPTERRAMEKKLREGELDCVVSTSALELGVDIGALDVCVLNGYPGTIAGTWQRLGRAGRRQRTALGVLVASSLPLDQYIIRNPEFFLGASPEQARIDPDQLLILLDHIRCAAFELPFRDGDSFGKEDLSEMLAYLQEHGVVHHEGGQWHWMEDSYPANSVSLRSVADGNFVVIDTTNGAQTVIAEVDYSSAPETIYEGAIYMVQSAPYQVERLDWDGRKAFVTRTQADYYTDAIDYTRLKILDDSVELAEDEPTRHCERIDSRVAEGEPTRHCERSEAISATGHHGLEGIETMVSTRRDCRVAGAPRNDGDSLADAPRNDGDSVADAPCNDGGSHVIASRRRSNLPTDCHGADAPRNDEASAHDSPRNDGGSVANAPRNDRAVVAQGEVHLVRRIAGYKKIRYYTHENIGYGNIELPDQEMHTTAVWWQINPHALDQAFDSRQLALDGFLGAGYALHIVAAMRMLSEPRDIGRAVGDGNAEWFATVGANGRGTLLNKDGEAIDPLGLQRFTPTLFLYDNYPGGIGISAPLFEQRTAIVNDAQALVSACECAHGCPSCIGPILASDEVRGYSPKQVAMRVLGLLAGKDRGTSDQPVIAPKGHKRGTQ
jgi:DEAD/DEAH box helicase domain-containing protein